MSKRKKRKKREITKTWIRKADLQIKIRTRNLRIRRDKNCSTQFGAMTLSPTHWLYLSEHCLLTDTRTLLSLTSLSVLVNHPLHLPTISLWTFAQFMSSGLLSKIFFATLVRFNAITFRNLLLPISATQTPPSDDFVPILAQRKLRGKIIEDFAADPRVALPANDCSKP